MVTGDRDSLQLVSDDVTVLYPRKGVSELTRFTPEAVVEKYGLTPRSTPTSRRCAATRATTCPAFPGWGRRPPPSGSSSTARCRRWSTTSTRCAARSATRCATTCASVVLNRELTDLVKDVPLAADPGHAAAAAVGPRPDPPPVRRPGVPGAARPVVRHAGRRRTRGRRGLRRARRRAGTRHGRGSGWPSTPATGSRSGLAVVGTHLPYDGDATALAIAAADGEGAYIDTADPDARGRGRAGGVAGRSRQAQGAARGQAGDARPAPVAGWTLDGVTSDTALAAYLVRPGQRSFTLDDLSLRYLRRELRAETLSSNNFRCSTTARARTTQAVQTAILRARAVVDLADALDAELARIDSTALLGEMELPVQRVLAGMENVGIAVDLGKLDDAAKPVRRPDPRRRRGRLRGDRQADQPRLAQAAAGGAVRRARHAEDQADQDRLHHRRGRAAVAVRQDRAPVPAAPAGPPRRHPAQGHRRRAAEVGGRRRAHPHHVQPDDRGDRPAVVDRAQPAEHPDPHRRGPADPRRVRRG